MLNEARKLWHSLNGDQREVYNEKYFECKITSMNEYSNDQVTLNQKFICNRRKCFISNLYS